MILKELAKEQEKTRVSLDFPKPLMDEIGKIAKKNKTSKTKIIKIAMERLVSESKKTK